MYFISLKLSLYLYAKYLVDLEFICIDYTITMCNMCYIILPIESSLGCIVVYLLFMECRVFLICNHYH